MAVDDPLTGVYAAVVHELGQLPAGFRVGQATRTETCQLNHLSAYHEACPRLTL